MPHLPGPPFLILSSQQRILIHQELLDLSQKGTQEPTEVASALFIINIFLVEKKGGQMHPVIILRALNGVVHYHQFKMEGMQLLRDNLLQGDWIDKPQGCLLEGPHCQQIPGTPLLRVERQLGMFLLPPLRPVVSTLVDILIMDQPPGTLRTLVDGLQIFSKTWGSF